MIGVGNLGRALLNNFPFENTGFTVDASFDVSPDAVSYTHLDVYKRQVPKLLTLSTLPMSQAVKTPRVSPREPLCARLEAGVACVPAAAP